MKEENITSINEIRKKIAESTGKLVLYIVLFVVVEALVNNLLFPFLASIRLQLPYISLSNQSISGYQPYVNILLSLAFGYLIIQGFISVIYWNLRLKYDHSTSASMRSIFRLVGVGVLVAAIAGAVAGGASGVALGGFIGIVVGFASQQVLGQAVSGLFLLLSRPFKIKDHISVTGDEGIVEEITTLFTYIAKNDNIIAIIPNNVVFGNKIYLYPKQTASQPQSGQGTVQQGK
ncbi:Large-conductance mechanosensitive channel MscMJLR [Metallosphaera sp. J1]|uniref:mechanosensitive ion channel domain-containing protein n=1 Tax=Metallosphaera javensis (ex Hofmann et al. 2022) TaxID=99938 RepID=UPI001EDE1E95|nr:mechanosensitive ion channel family protein [Metallosphaera javensis (ex Hofmann et al. 2022)]MCG3108522.1 Large-conductance mechanosensitive channel MscMJLR [Metallosphaera javensis (ex Hofmann et al. 2022)]